MAVVLFVAALVWGSLSAKFLMQTLVSLISAAISLTAIVFSEVSKVVNVTGTLIGLFQATLCGALLLGGSWIVSNYVQYDSWNAASIASLVAFLGTVIFVCPQIPGKLLLVKMCAWQPDFMEDSMRVPPGERVALARKYRLELRRFSDCR